MRKHVLQACVLVGALSFASAAANAQEMVHALAGKVTAIYPVTKMIEVSTDDGSMGTFGVMTKPVSLNFPKNVKMLTVPAGTFTQKDAQVVVFFFGEDNTVRTTVALEDLGSAPLLKSAGTVVKLDKHAHMLTIKDEAGKEITFHIDAKTIADGTSGVISGEKFEANQGAKVRVVANTENGVETALFIRAMSL